MTDRMRCLAAMALVLLISCNETDKEQKGNGKKTAAVKDSPSLQPTTLQPQSEPQKGEYCLITRIYEGEGVTYIDADYIQFLMGDKAVAAAKKHGDALIDIDKKGDTVYSVPNDYYILNENKKIRTLTLAPNFVYAPVVVGDELKGDAMSILKSRVKNNWIFVLTVKDNVVTRITEQFLP
jgi:hypothetical protein